MKEDQFFNVIEKLNKEKSDLQNGREYKLGSAILRYSYNITHFKVSELVKDIKDKIAARAIAKKYTVTNGHHPSIKYLSDCSYKKPKIAIYTCVIGNYDNVQRPLVTFDNVDFFLLTDNPDLYKNNYDDWQIIRLPNNILRMGNILANRYVKLHPHEFFSSYEYTIYMDGNIRVVGDVRQFILQCSEKTGVAMHFHRERDCIYQEANVCCMLRRGNAEYIKKQMIRYKKDGFPEHFGMNEATIIVSDINNEVSKNLEDSWWNEFIKSHSLRDQLAWPYVLWKQGFCIDDVGFLGNNIYQNYKLEIVKHRR